MLGYYETQSLDPCFNLAFEEQLLETVRSGELLMLWQNDRTAVIGLNQNAAEEVDAGAAKRLGVTVVRRMTGGGAVYHDLGNLNYSFITDAGDAAELSFERFTAPVCAALGSLGVSAEATGRNDITVRGLKVSGTARRLYSGRILHHGTLLFRTDRETMSAVLRPDGSKFSGKAAKSVRARVGQICSFLPEGPTLEGFKAELLRALAPEGLERRSLDAAALREVERRAERYRSWDWTWARSPDFGFKSSRRFPAGSLTVSLDVSGGVIRGAALSGDFLAAVPAGPLLEGLRGARFEREAVREAVEGLDLANILGGIGLEELLSLIFD